MMHARGIFFGAVTTDWHFPDSLYWAKKELCINVLRIWRNGGWGKRENGGGGLVSQRE